MRSSPHPKHTYLRSNFWAIALGLALSFLIPPAAVADPKAVPVINGHSAESDRWPWMVSLGFADSDAAYGHFCGGSLVAPNFVLTAAHCVTDMVSAPYQIVATIGRTRLTAEAGERIPANGILVHPDYNPETIANDVALVRLESPSSFPPIKVVGDNDFPYWQGGALAYLIGWGVTDSNFEVRPDNLQQAEFPIVDEHACEERLGLGFQRSSMICAGKLASGPLSEDGLDACSGDSGGPLMVETPEGWKIAGAVSWGYNCGDDKYWGVYSRIAKFKDWIENPPGVAPFSIGAPSIEGTPREGARIRCQKGTWGGDEPITISYSWSDAKRPGSRLGRRPALKLGRRDVGRKLTCQVTARNAAGTMTQTSEAFGPIFPAASRHRFEGKLGTRQPRVSMLCGPSRCELLVETGPKSLQSLSLLAMDRHCSSLDCAGGKWQNGTQISKGNWLFRLERNASAWAIYLRMVGSDSSVETAFLRLNASGS